MAQHILGVDLGARAVKAVLVEGTYHGFVVLDAASAEVPPAPPDGEGAGLLARQGAALEGLLAARGWRVDAAYASLPGASAAFHVVTLPFTDPHRLEQTVGFEVEGQIPFELDAVAWDWQPLRVQEGKTELLVGVVRKEELAALLGALAPAGLDPRAVVPAGVAYSALLAPGVTADAPGSTPDGAVAPAEIVVDVGAERSSVCVARAGVCEAARTFAPGAGHLVRTLAGELGVPEDAAASIVVARATGADLAEGPLEETGRADDALRRALAPLVREVRATLRAWRARVGPRPAVRLVLAGEVARLPLLAEALAAEVDGPVVPLALAGAAGARLGPADAPRYGLALALALRGHQGPRAARMNLRRGALAYTRDFEHLKGKVARLGAYAALVMVLAVASAGVKGFALSRQEAALDRALCDAEQQIIGRCYEDFAQAQSVLRGRSGAGGALPKVSAVELFGELSERVPLAIPLRLDRIEITRDKLHVEGTTDAAENVDRIVGALKGSRCFGDARSGSARKRATDGKFEFSVDAGLTCLESGARDAAGGRG
ncbi:pilus assembly protein PilM [Anaeromyxobacter oryzisoli]|uniref:pilus assembly protein PilM n=1 Tax=Anaeromyxobacter oryzisoli TaxID=2925408 RepID=UPI001F57AD92|nr:pilus assembly protein PilM [Anaeromyxobacter sp. SG63]